MPLAVIAARSSILTKRAFGPRVGFAYSYNDKTVLRGGYGIMYTRRGAVGGREGARIGTGLTGINANAPLVSPNGSFIPAFFWENGIPPYATGPIYDETYQSGIRYRERSGRRRDLWRSGQPAASLSELEPFDPALAYSFVGLDGGLRGKQWQTACAAAGAAFGQIRSTPDIWP